MFVDLVGSTALSAQLDPEHMREVIRAYQNTVTAAVTRFEGQVAKFMGDGVLVYFGWPQAHENDAERAVRTGLAVVAAVADLRTPKGAPLAARVGIASGLVVVGDLIGQGAAEEEVVIGETPNLAARLQGIAQPGAVVVAQGTYQLLGALYQAIDLGTRELKGFERPVRAWHVIGEAQVENRFEALHGAAIRPLVGREDELRTLLDCWRWAKAGNGQLVLLSGEPGIGKSRITQSLREHLHGEPHTRLLYQCSPFHTSSALYPIAQQLSGVARLSDNDPADVKLDKLEALVERGAGSVDEPMRLLADLLSIPPTGRYEQLELTPQRRKEKTLNVLQEQLASLSRRGPVLLIWEDIHWIDPTSLELLDRVVEQIQRLPILAVVTFRPEFRATWTDLPHTTVVMLNRLERQQAGALAHYVARGKALPGVVLDQIIAKTDGVPLFLEELTKLIIESNFLIDEGERYALAGPLPAFAVPATLHDSLMARLDRLTATKETAQIGSVIGREFHYELLSAVFPWDEGALRRACFGPRCRVSKPFT
jgi:class 3 adenylate cyclase